MPFTVLTKPTRNNIFRFFTLRLLLSFTLYSNILLPNPSAFSFTETTSTPLDTLVNHAPTPHIFLSGEMTISYQPTRPDLAKRKLAQIQELRKNISRLRLSTHERDLLLEAWSRQEKEIMGAERSTTFSLTLYDDELLLIVDSQEICHLTPNYCDTGLSLVTDNLRIRPSIINRRFFFPVNPPWPIATVFYLTPQRLSQMYMTTHVTGDDTSFTVTFSQPKPRKANTDVRLLDEFVILTYNIGISRVFPLSVEFYTTTKYPRKHFKWELFYEPDSRIPTGFPTKVKGWLYQPDESGTNQLRVSYEAKFTYADDKVELSKPLAAQIWAPKSEVLDSRFHPRPEVNYRYRPNLSEDEIVLLRAKNADREPVVVSSQEGSFLRWSIGLTILLFSTYMVVRQLRRS